jgi:hypothetical protein
MCRIRDREMAQRAFAAAPSNECDKVPPFNVATALWRADEVRKGRRSETRRYSELLTHVS